MPLENGDRTLLVRIDERLEALTHSVDQLRANVVTRDECALRQHQHDARATFSRAESLSKVFAILSIGVGIIYTVLKHA